MKGIWVGPILSPVVQAKPGGGKLSDKVLNSLSNIECLKASPEHSCQMSGPAGLILQWHENHPLTLIAKHRKFDDLTKFFGCFKKQGSHFSERFKKRQHGIKRRAI